MKNIKLLYNIMSKSNYNKLIMKFLILIFLLTIILYIIRIYYKNFNIKFNHMLKINNLKWNLELSSKYTDKL